MSNTEIVVEVHPQLHLDLNHFVTSVLPKSSFLLHQPPGVHPSSTCWRPTLAICRWTRHYKSLFYFTRYFPFCKSTVRKWSNHVLPPLTTRDGHKPLLVCRRRVAVLCRNEPAHLWSLRVKTCFASEIILSQTMEKRRSKQSSEMKKSRRWVFPRDVATHGTGTGVYIRPRSRDALDGVLNCRGPYSMTGQTLLGNQQKAPP